MVRDGYIYGLSLLAVAAVLAWATGIWAWSIAPVLLAAFFLWFFRDPRRTDRKSTRLNSGHANISYALFCLKKKKNTTEQNTHRSGDRGQLHNAHSCAPG